ncbi:MAG: aminotransferase class V-fold PLP-dependent enzyme [Planctomycetota bacterium]
MSETARPLAAARSDSVSPLPSQRELFDLPADITYLNCAFMSPVMHRVHEAGRAGLGLRGRPWELGADDFFAPAEHVRGLFARLIEADADDVAFVPAVSYGIGTAARAVACAAGQRIITLREQFPSNIYPWQALAEQTGATWTPLDYPDDHDLTAALLETIGPDTAAVAVPQVHWFTGARIDLAAVGRRCREVGAALVVDATQSMGTSALSVREIQPDFLITATYKGLLGPYGLCFLYAAPHRRDAAPLEEGWLNRHNSHDFANLTDYAADYRPGARRYDMGERANTVALPMARAAFAQLLEWTLPRVERSVTQLIHRVIDEAQAAGLEHTPPRFCSPNMVGVRLPDDAPGDTAARLKQAGAYVSIRKGRMRLSPHVYNDEQDIADFFRLLQQVT